MFAPPLIALYWKTYVRKRTASTGGALTQREPQQRLDAVPARDGRGSPPYAMMDSVASVFITGQVRTKLIGTDGVQEALGSAPRVRKSAYTACWQRPVLQKACPVVPRQQSLSR